MNKDTLKKLNIIIKYKLIKKEMTLKPFTLFILSTAVDAGINSTFRNPSGETSHIWPNGVPHNMASVAFLDMLRKDLEKGDFDEDLLFEGVENEDDINWRLLELYEEHKLGQNMKLSKYYP